VIKSTGPPAFCMQAYVHTFRKELGSHLFKVIHYFYLEETLDTGNLFCAYPCRAQALANRNKGTCPMVTLYCPHDNGISSQSLNFLPNQNFPCPRNRPRPRNLGGGGTTAARGGQNDLPTNPSLNKETVYSSSPLLHPSSRQWQPCRHPPQQHGLFRRAQV